MTRQRISVAAFIAMALLLVIVGAARGQQTSSKPAEPPQAAKDPTSTPQPVSSPSPSPNPRHSRGRIKRPKGGQPVIAPIPISSPAIGPGLVLVLGYVF